MNQVTRPNEELCPDVPDSELREQLAACREDWQRVCDALGAKGEHMDPDVVVRAIAALAPHSGGDGDALLDECYMAMQAAMNVIDVNEGPGLEHSRVVNALADCRIKIEQRNASRRLATPTQEAGPNDADAEGFDAILRQAGVL